MEVSTLQEILDEDLKNKSPEFRKKFLQYKVFTVWEKIVPSVVAKEIFPLRIDDETLIIYAKNSVAKDTFKFLAEEVLQALNNISGAEIFKKFAFAKSFERLKKNQNKKKYSPPKKLDVELSAEEISECEKKVAWIEDAELKKISLEGFISLKKSEKIKIATGWRKCKLCKNFCTPDEVLCVTCKISEKNKMRDEIRKIFYKNPEKNYPSILQEIQKNFPHIAKEVNEETISSERAAMIREISVRVSIGDSESDLARTLVSIYKSLPKDKLTAAIMNRALYELRFDLANRIF